MEPTIPLTDISVWLVAKVFVLFAIFVYLIFSMVIIRQVGLMTDTLEVGFETPVKFAAALHFILALGVFILALVIL